MTLLAKSTVNRDVIRVDLPGWYQNTEAPSSLSPCLQLCPSVPLPLRRQSCCLLTTIIFQHASSPLAAGCTIMDFIQCHLPFGQLFEGSYAQSAYDYSAHLRNQCAMDAPRASIVAYHRAPSVLPCGPILLHAPRMDLSRQAQDA